MTVRVLTVDSARTVPPFNVAVRVLTVDSALTAHPYADTYSFLCTYLLSLLNCVCVLIDISCSSIDRKKGSIFSCFLRSVSPSVKRSRLYPSAQVSSANADMDGDMEYARIVKYSALWTTFLFLYQLVLDLRKCWSWRIMKQSLRCAARDAQIR